ncbi:MAG: hypothetical protein IJI63_04195 [Clostridiales bacterium]|nr:hypothetical protein [Oscillospiraceae bacterium]MBR0395692.1 hypothetical protein [Clostridiales bacterium]
MEITGTDIKARLAKCNLTKIWLLNQLNKRGIKISVTTLSLILSESYSNKEKSSLVIAEAAEIISKYENAMGDS